MFNDSICTNAPAETATDAGVAGAGVSCSFGRISRNEALIFGCEK